MKTSGQRLRDRPGFPVGVVFLCTAAIFAVWTVTALVDAAGSKPPPPDGSFIPPGLAIAAIVAVTAVWSGLSWWTLTRADHLAVARLLIALVVAGPLGWGLAALDSATLDLINSEPVGPVLMVALLLVTPVISVVGIIAAVVEIVVARRQKSAKPFGV
ncbi:hypothetical protein [Dietzia sp.]|uniref:hypothetical protein n=1 Tax=Dietzia sp. TaxID=1871616 RepID=UPI002FDA0C1C